MNKMDRRRFIKMVALLPTALTVLSPKGVLGAQTPSASTLEIINLRRLALEVERQVRDGYELLLDHHALDVMDDTVLKAFEDAFRSLMDVYVGRKVMASATVTCNKKNNPMEKRKTGFPCVDIVWSVYLPGGKKDITINVGPNMEAWDAAQAVRATGGS